MMKKVIKMKKVFLVFDGEATIAVTDNRADADMMASEYEFAVGAADSNVFVYETTFGSYIGEVYNNVIFKQFVE
jgi:hypothetical protein